MPEPSIFPDLVPRALRRRANDSPWVAFLRRACCGLLFVLFYTVWLVGYLGVEVMRAAWKEWKDLRKVCMERLPLEASTSHSWRRSLVFGLVFNLMIGPIIFVSNLVHKGLEPRLGSWLTEIISLLTAAAMGGIVSGVIYCWRRWRSRKPTVTEPKPPALR
jgi:hypothetical protein